MPKGDIKIISAWSQWKIQTRQYIQILLSDRKNLLVSLLFPVVAAIITVWLAGKDMFVHYEGTKSACFVIVSAAIWGGLFNSIQSVVKERANIKREYINGLRIRCYTMSRAVIQLFLCIVQSIILCCTFIGVKYIYCNDLPVNGLIFNNPLIEYYISIFLLMYAADMMGLLISCMVRKTETANVMAPYILIVQLIFSGILFTMKGIAEKFSYIMLSRWGMEALGSISNINNMKLKIQMTFPDIPHETEKMFNADAMHLVRIWGILLIFIILFLIFGNMFLHMISKDKR
ncbi:MAG: ABC transporter permease [Butyrivibrio sp.]